jgi:hypothetical protein
MALKDLLTDLSNFKYTNYENAGANNSQTAGRHGGTEPLGQPPHSEEHSLYDDGVGGLGNPQSFTVRGYTVSDIISGRHGGMVGPTPAQPPHPDDHSEFDNGVGFGVAPSDNPQSFDVRGYTITGNKRFYIGWQGDIMNHPLSDYGIGAFDTISGVFDHTQTRDKLRNVYSNYPELTFGADIDGGINGLNGSIHIGNQDLPEVVGGGVTYYGNLNSITPRGSIYRAGDGTYRVPQSGHTTNPPGVTTQYPSNIPTFDGTQITHNIPQITLSGPFTDTYQSTLTDGTNGTWENPNVPNAHGSDFMTTPIGESALPTNSVTHIVDMITLSGPTIQAYHTTLNTSPISSGAHGSDFQTTPIEAYSSIFATQDGLLMNSIYDSGFKRGDMYMNHSPETSIPIFKDFTQSDKSLKPSSQWDPQKYGSNFVDTQYTFFGGEEKEFRFDDRIPYNIPARDNNVIGFDQPFILKDIGDRWGPGKLGAIDEGLFRGGFVTSAARTVADVFRLGKFILTPTGIMFGLKQAGLQLLNPRAETRIWNPLSLGSVAPMVHVDRHLGGGTYEDAIDKNGWDSDGFGSILDGYADAVISPVPSVGLIFTTGRRSTLAHTLAMVPSMGGKMALPGIPELKWSDFPVGNIDSLSKNIVGENKYRAKDGLGNKEYTISDGTPIIPARNPEAGFKSGILGGRFAGSPFTTMFINEDGLFPSEALTDAVLKTDIFDGNTFSSDSRYDEGWTFDGGISGGGLAISGKNINKVRTFGRNEVISRTIHHEENIESVLGGWEPPIYSPYEVIEYGETVRSPIARQRVFYNNGDTSIPAGQYAIYDTYADGEIGNRGGISRGPKVIRPESMIGNIYTIGDQYYKHGVKYPINWFKDLTIGKSDGKVSEGFFEQGTTLRNVFIGSDKRIYADTLNGEVPLGGSREIRGHTNLSKIYIESVFAGDKWSTGKKYWDKDRLIQDGDELLISRGTDMRTTHLETPAAKVEQIYQIAGDPVVAGGTKFYTLESDPNKGGLSRGDRVFEEGVFAGDLYEKGSEYFPKHHSLIEGSKELDISKGKTVRLATTSKAGTFPYAQQKQVYKNVNDTITIGTDKKYQLGTFGNTPVDYKTRGDRVFKEGVFAGDFYSKETPYASGDTIASIQSSTRDDISGYIQIGNFLNAPVVDAAKKRSTYTYVFEGGSPIIPPKQVKDVGTAVKVATLSQPSGESVRTLYTNHYKEGTLYLSGHGTSILPITPIKAPAGVSISKKVGDYTYSKLTTLYEEDINPKPTSLKDNTFPNFSGDLYDKDSKYRSQISSFGIVQSPPTLTRLRTHANTGDPTVTIKTSHPESDPNVPRLSAEGKYKNGLEDIKLQDFPLINLTGDGNLGGERQSLGFVNKTLTGLQGNLFGIPNTTRHGFGVLDNKKYTEIIESPDGFGGKGTLQGTTDTAKDGKLPHVSKTLAYEHKFAPAGVKDVLGTDKKPDFKTIKTPKNLGTSFSENILDKYKTLAYGDIPTNTDESEKYGKKTGKAADNDKGGQYPGQAKDISTTGLVYKIDSEGKLGLVKKDEKNYMYGTKTGIGEPDSVNMTKYGEDGGDKVHGGPNFYPDDYIKFKFFDIVNKKNIIFRAFLSGISETFSPEWSSEKYIGRPDSVHVYQGVERSMSFEFMIVPSSKQELPILWEKLNYLVGFTYPTWKPQGSSGKRMEAPFMNLTLGDMYNAVPGYLSSLSISVDDNSPWEIDEGFQLPHAINVSCEFTHIGQHALASQGTHYDFGGKDKTWLKPYNSKDGTLGERPAGWAAKTELFGV